jgi:hypothetical protein
LASTNYGVPHYIININYTHHSLPPQYEPFLFCKWMNITIQYYFGVIVNFMTIQFFKHTQENSKRKEHLKVVVNPHVLISRQVWMLFLNPHQKLILPHDFLKLCYVLVRLTAIFQGFCIKLCYAPPTINAKINL